MRLGKTLVVASLLAAAGSGLYAQTKTTPTPPPAKTGAAKAPAKTSSKKAAATATSGTPAAAPAESEQKVARRDPFESLTSRQDAAAKNAANLPPGKPGLQIGTLRLDGIVKAPNGMIAVVTNPQSRTYFLRDGDQLYDGRVEKIGMDSVSFHEIGKDAFGKPVERQVNKRIYSSAGEQQ
jgi:Tfp pilus assembly protein PilP